MTEIKVYLYASENDCYVELWKSVDEEKYYGRYTYNDAGTWYYVCDPLGYCELDHTVNDDIRSLAYFALLLYPVVVLYFCESDCINMPIILRNISVACDIDCAFTLLSLFNFRYLTAYIY